MSNGESAEKAREEVSREMTLESLPRCTATSSTTHAPSTSHATHAQAVSMEDLQRYLFSRREVRAVSFDEVKRRKENRNGRGFWCDVCQSSSSSPCPLHTKTKATTDPQQSKQAYAFESFPNEVQLCSSSIPGVEYGVCAKCQIPKGTWIGPYEGVKVKPDDVTPGADAGYMWEVFHDGRLAFYLDGSDENSASWMRFIRCARNKEEQNLYAFQYMGNIYYRAFRDISPGTELLVWYDETYPQFMGIPLEIREIGNPKRTEGTHDSEVVVVVSPNGAPCTATSTSPRVTAPQLNDHMRHQHPGHRFPRPHLGYSHPLPHPHFGPYHGQVPPHQGPNPGSFFNQTAVTSTLTSNERAAEFQPMGFQRENVAPVSLPRLPHAPMEQTNQGANVLPVLPWQHASSQSQLSPRKRRDSFKGAREIATDVQMDDEENDDEDVECYKIPPPTARTEQRESDSDEKSDGDKDEVFKCGQCNTSFNQRSALHIHVCPLVPYNPYHCGHCNQSFSDPNELRNHAIIHSTEKPFRCGYCSRAFSGATTLNNHIRTHTGEKPFMCEACGKSFSQASQLSRHQKIPGDCVN